MDRIMPALRQAAPGDLDAVREMVRAHCREEAPSLPISEARLSAAVQACMQQGGILVSCADGVPVGTIGVTVDAPYWSDRPWMIGLWAYVKGGHRKDPHMREMLSTVLEVAHSRHMPLRFEVWGGHRTAGKACLFKRELGGPSGALFFARG